MEKENKLDKRTLGNWKGKHHTEETKQKMRLAKLGKKLSLDHRRKLGESRKLDKHWNWKGGIKYIPYSKEFTKRFKKDIKNRDKCCMICNQNFEDLRLLKRQIDIHHIDYNKEMTIRENCITLCQNCHIKTNTNREHWIKFFHSLLSERYGYKYSENDIVLEVGNE